MSASLTKLSSCPSSPRAPPTSSQAARTASTIRLTASRHDEAPVNSSAGSVNALPRRVRVGSIGSALKDAVVVGASCACAVFDRMLESRGTPSPRDRRAIGDIRVRMKSDVALELDAPKFSRADEALLAMVVFERKGADGPEGMTGFVGDNGGGGVSGEFRIE
jgi:hypothetical protein